MADFNPSAGTQSPTGTPGNTAPRFCANCGTAITPDTAFCPNCGQPVAGAAAPSAPVTVSPVNPTDRAGISKQDYIDHYAPEKLIKNIKSAAILCYVCAGITAVVSILMNPFGLIDAAILFVLALIMHLKRSKVFAFLVLGFSILEVVLTLALTGSFTGWLWVVAGILAVSAFGKLDKAYEAFRSGAD